MKPGSAIARSSGRLQPSEKLCGNLALLISVMLSPGICEHIKDSRDVPTSCVAGTSGLFVVVVVLNGSVDPRTYFASPGPQASTVPSGVGSQILNLS